MGGPNLQKDHERNCQGAHTPSSCCRRSCHQIRSMRTASTPRAIRLQSSRGSLTSGVPTIAAPTTALFPSAAAACCRSDPLSVHSAGQAASGVTCILSLDVSCRARSKLRCMFRCLARLSVTMNRVAQREKERESGRERENRSHREWELYSMCPQHAHSLIDSGSSRGKMHVHNFKLK